jgi:hypothetical protein
MKDFAIILFIVLGVLLVAFSYVFDLEAFSSHPSPYVSKDSFVRIDDSIPWISYELQVTTTVHYSSWLWYWERSRMKDSLFVFNETLINKRLEDPYSVHWDRDGVIKERLFPIENFSFEAIEIDSVSYQLLIIKTIGTQTWKEKPPS